MKRLAEVQVVPLKARAASLFAFQGTGRHAAATAAEQAGDSIVTLSVPWLCHVSLKYNPWLSVEETAAPGDGDRSLGSTAAPTMSWLPLSARDPCCAAGTHRCFGTSLKSS